MQFFIAGLFLKYSRSARIHENIGGINMATSVQFKLTHSMQKVLPYHTAADIEACPPLNGLIGETLSFQIAYYGQSDDCNNDYYFKVELDSIIAPFASIRRVELVPSGYSAHATFDEHYLTTRPGMLPDLLVPYMNGEAIRAIPNQWRALWIDIKLTKQLVEALNRNVVVCVSCESLGQEQLASFKLPLQVLPCSLPEQAIIHTEWFHVDCLANYYNVDVFSEEHWRVIDSFMSSANKHGINMLLTPVFTPPLDTAIGGERLTVQLVDVIVENNQYSFNFEKLERWIDLCNKNNISYIEISHLFTQWGAKHAPKIMATVAGKKKQLFGWFTEATGAEYTAFLHQFIPALKTKLKELGVLDKTWFHISDEPNVNQKESYQAAKRVVEPLLEGCNIVDALSSFEFYKEGIVDNPVVAIDHIQPFIDAGVKQLWAYYCTSQCLDVSNRFMSMPSYRNRIIGVQLYLYDIKGFLHWGFNFYNNQFSLKAINPYQVTDAGEAFPSGDAFLVYPAPEGTVYESIRGVVFQEALYDLRALQLLEELVGREEVITLIHEDVAETITFSSYPHSSEYLFSLRQKVNKRIEVLRSNV